VQKAVFVEQGVEHAGVYLLLFFKLRASELLHQFNQLCDLLVDLMRFRCENSLEEVVCSIIDLV
jgi:hypothetical protein